MAADGSSCRRKFSHLNQHGELFFESLHAAGELHAGFWEAEVVSHLKNDAGGLMLD